MSSLRALVWIVEDTWRSLVSEAAAFLPAEAEVTLLHVADAAVEELASGGRAGLLGRRPHSEPLRVISEDAAAALLRDAEACLGRSARRVALRGVVKREVVAAAEGMDLLVLARDGDLSRLGPHSLGPDARFVVDHAPCRVLLVWPDEAPELSTMGRPHHDRPPDGDARKGGAPRRRPPR